VKKRAIMQRRMPVNTISPHISPIDEKIGSENVLKYWC
jgi:hypothetical protein